MKAFEVLYFFRFFYFKFSSSKKRLKDRLNIKNLEASLKKNEKKIDNFCLAGNNSEFFINKFSDVLIYK